MGFASIIVNLPYFQSVIDFNDEEWKPCINEQGKFHFSTDKSKWIGYEQFAKYRDKILALFHITDQISERCKIASVSQHDDYASIVILSPDVAQCGCYFENIPLVTRIQDGAEVFDHFDMSMVNEARQEIEDIKQNGLTGDALKLYEMTYGKR